MRTHGTRSCYKAGCRCDDCRAANAAYHRQHRVEMAEAKPESKTPERIAAAVGVAIAIGSVWVRMRRERRQAPTGR